VTISITWCRPGDALDELAAAVARAKAGRPLRPVSVVVPTNAAGVMARRALGARGGVAAVDMVTLFRLAELMAAPSLTASGRRPVSTPVVDLAIRQVLDREPGMFAPVAEHPSTVVALRDLHRELRAAGGPATAALAGASARGREAARVSASTTTLLRDRWYDEGDLLARAVDVAVAGVPERLEQTVLHLPQRLGRPEAALVRAIAGSGDVQVLIAATGSQPGDRELHDIAAAIDESATSATAALRPVASVVDVGIVSATDADDEVRVAVRRIVDAARSGVAFDRMAVLWPADRPYARLVEHHLGEVDVPWNGRPGTLLTERLVPRLLLDLLDVDRRGLRRRDLFELLADVPARGLDGRRLPRAAWERVSRAAGVSRDDHWAPRLTAFARDLRARAVDGTSSRADAADELVTFVAALRRTLGPPGSTRTWREWATWCTAQLERWIGRADLAALDEEEARAWDETVKVLDRLGDLDQVGPPVRRRELRATLLAELEVAPARAGRVGTGVTVGSLTGAAGLDVDVAVVLGAADGALPPLPRVDPLVSDADRAAAGLDTADAHAARAHRQFLSVLDSCGSVLVTYPRGDLRTTSHREPSRWLAAHLGDVPVRHTASHVAGLMGTAFPVCAREHRLRRRATHTAAGGDVGAAPGAAVDVVLQRALQLRAARRSTQLTVYDGDLSAVPVPPLDRPVSPTQLEAWAACPHAYFVRYLLGVREIDEPGDALAITPIDRGSALHEALDGFHGAVLRGELPQPGADGWTTTHADALGEIFDRVAAATELAGRTGRAASWMDERERMRADLLDWLRADHVHVVDRRARVVSSEWRFGADGTVTLSLPGGRLLAVTGAIDRVDESADGFVVTDHKTGRFDRYRAISATDPTAGGTMLQLPAYAAATLALTGRPDATVRAEYSFFRAGGYRRVGYTFDPQVWTSVGEALGRVVAGIEAGFYPSVPERPGWSPFVPCADCEPDGLGRTERWIEWQAKCHDPRLAPWFGEPADATADDGHEP
jgi:ATP-dependent helicase/nuclease subunit B